MTVTIEGDFVVFLIGMQYNRLWKLHKWLPVAQAMPKMIKEFSKKPESGFLGFQLFGGIPPVMVQYWRSFEHLEAYAKDREGFHYPARNDQTKSEATEELYYCRMLDDLELEKQLITERLSQADQRIALSMELLKDLDAGIKTKNYLLNQFLLANRAEQYVPRSVTFHDLTSSGDLKLLRDIPLKNSLIQFYAEEENKVVQLKQNRDETINEIFAMINSSPDFGALQEYDYVKDQLEPEIFSTLINIDWTKDKSSPHYRRFQHVVLFNMTMSDREKQHLKAINELMEAPFNLLNDKCKTQKLTE